VAQMGSRRWSRVAFAYAGPCPFAAVDCLMSLLSFHLFALHAWVCRSAHSNCIVVYRNFFYAITITVTIPHMISRISLSISTYLCNPLLCLCYSFSLFVVLHLISHSFSWRMPSRLIYIDLAYATIPVFLWGVCTTL
jgi:hypothetical protein